MAKEFKEYDKKYKHLGTHVLTSDQRNTASLIRRWDLVVDSWDREFIRYAVYLHESAERWQRYRVQLKGLTTREKLYMLGLYHYQHCFGAFSAKDDLLYMVEKCRVDNYIGALVRGGQIVSGTYEVIDG